MRSIVLALALLLATVMVDAGKHHRRHKKTDATKHQEEFLDLSDFPSSPGENHPGIPGGPGDSDKPNVPHDPDDPAASADDPDNDFMTPSVPERKSLSRRLRARLEEARRESKEHVH